MVSSGAGHVGGAGLRFTFGLGGAKTEVTVAGDISDGLWHSADVEYFNRVSTHHKEMKIFA